MTYKERYYRDHANDKKALSVRLIELAVDISTMLAFIMMVVLLATDFGDRPIIWAIMYAVSLLIFYCGMSYKTRFDDEDERI